MTPDGVVDKQTWYRLLKGDKVTVQQVSAPGGVFAGNGLGGAPASRQHAVWAAPAKGVWEWPLEDKFAEALRLTVPKLSGNMRHEFEALLSPTNLGLMAGRPSRPSTGRIARIHSERRRRSGRDPGQHHHTQCAQTHALERTTNRSLAKPC